MHILFVCTGNTCRSPMAEALMRHLAKEQSVKVEVRSAGVSAWDGSSMSSHAQQVLRDWNIDGRDFSSQSLKPTTVEWADLILTLTTGHKQHVLQQFPEMTEKVFTLKEFAHLSKDEQATNAIDELTSFIAELQIQLSQGEQPTTEQMLRLRELQAMVPNMDVQDPYGGSLHDYKQAADEIHQALATIIDRLFKN